MSDSITQFEITIKRLPKLINQMGSKHWGYKKKEIDEWNSLIFYMTLPYKPKAPIKKAHIKYVRHSSNRPDTDNLVISFKHVQDALVRSNILVNDRHENVVGEYGWEYAPRKSGKITISFCELKGE